MWHSEAGSVAVVPLSRNIDRIGPNPVEMRAQSRDRGA